MNDCTRKGQPKGSELQLAAKTCNLQHCAQPCTARYLRMHEMWRKGCENSSCSVAKTREDARAAHSCSLNFSDSVIEQKSVQYSDCADFFDLKSRGYRFVIGTRHDQLCRLRFAFKGCQIEDFPNSK